MTLDTIANPCEIEIGFPDETNEQFAEGAATSFGKNQFVIAEPDACTDIVANTVLRDCASALPGVSYDQNLVSEFTLDGTTAAGTYDVC